MIFYVATERFSSTVRHFLDRNRAELRGVLALLTYEELFFEGAGPIGHYIFTDFDRLSRYELESAAAFAEALLAAAPEARILNHPLKALERYPLLVALHRAGINDFAATRIECGERPDRYPVFIRAEDGYGGPESDLLNNDEEFDAALADLTRRGLPRRGRIAVGYANERAADGYFHKYGAFNIGGRIVPHDRMYGRNWVVKIRFEERPWAEGRDATYGDSASGAATELNYILDNPHRDVLARAFAVARIDYGRADYGVVDGRVQVYEINTNPHLPIRTDADPRAERRAIVRRGILDALKAIDTPIAASGRIGFRQSGPRAHNLHLPRRRLPISLARKASDFLRRRQSRRRSLSDALSAEPPTPVTSSLEDPVTCGEDLAANTTRAISVAGERCAGCADYHIVNTLKRLSGLMMWERGGRAALVAPLRRIFEEFKGRSADRFDVLIAACADTAVLSTCAHAAWLAGEALFGRTNFTVIDRCSTPLLLCKEYGARHKLRVAAETIDLLDTARNFAADLIVLHNFLPFVPVDRQGALLQTLARWLTKDGRLVIWNPVVLAPANREASRSRVMNQIATIKAKIDNGEIEINEPKPTLFDRLDRMVDDPRPGEKRFTDIGSLPTLVTSSGLEVRSVDEVPIGTSRNSLYTIVVAGRPA